MSTIKDTPDLTYSVPTLPPHELRYLCFLPRYVRADAVRSRARSDVSQVNVSKVRLAELGLSHSWGGFEMAVKDAGAGLGRC